MVVADSMQLLYARTEFKNFDLSDLAFKFEQGNLDYFVLSDPSKIERVIRAYEHMYNSRNPNSIIPLAEQISHVSAMICSGWIKRPEESSYWRSQRNLPALIVENPAENDHDMDSPTLADGNTSVPRKSAATWASPTYTFDYARTSPDYTPCTPERWPSPTPPDVSPITPKHQQIGIEALAFLDNTP